MNAKPDTRFIPGRICSEWVGEVRAAYGKVELARLGLRAEPSDLTEARCAAAYAALDLLASVSRDLEQLADGIDQTGLVSPPAAGGSR